MQWDADLIPPFSYSNIGLWIFLIGIITIILMVLLIKISKMVKENKSVEKPIDINKIKNDYLRRIDILINNVNSNTITERKAYNELSLIIREFIYRTTKIDVLKYTLADAKASNSKELVELLNEYYEPEFSREGKGNLNISIENTRKVIKEWK